MSWYDSGGFNLKVLSDGSDRSDHSAVIRIAIDVGNGRRERINITKSDLLMIRRDVNRTLKQLQERSGRCSNA